MERLMDDWSISLRSLDSSACTAASKCRRPTRYSPGATLVELMVALVLASIILLALTVVFAGGSEDRKEIERVSRQIENGAYGIQLLGDDLRLAGYYGEFDPTTLTVPASLPSLCVTDPTILSGLLRMPMQGLNEVTADQTCGTQTLKVLSGNDVVVIRRVQTCLSGPTPDADCDTSGPYFQAASCETTLLSTTPTDAFKLSASTTSLTLQKKDCATSANYRSYRAHVYYVSPEDKPGDGIPTLKRAELSGADYRIVPLVEGVEQFQVEYGVDTNGDGVPDSWTDAPSSVANWTNVVAARVYILVRNLERSARYTDAKSYVMGNKTFTPASADLGYKRHLYRTEVLLNNVAGRRVS
jgi:type IV pilus assembly protein PilW